MTGFHFTVLIQLLYRVGKAPTVILQPNRTVVYRGERVTLRCEIWGGGGTEWTYEWKTNNGNAEKSSNEYIINRVSDTNSGKYSCMARGDHQLTEWSDAVTLTVRLSKPTVILEPSGPVVYRGEKVTLRCEIWGGGGTEWTYEWKTNNGNAEKSSNEYRINRVSDTNSGEYSCMARGDHQLTEWSDAVTLTVRLSKPTVILEPSGPVVYSGEKVTLRCEIWEGGRRTQWTYEWKRNNGNAEKRSREYRIITVNEYHSGKYSCMARGDHQLTEWSDAVTLTVRLPITPTVIKQPSWAQIYRGERVTLRCEIQDDGGTQWTYEWRPNNINSPTSSEFMITADSRGYYSCRGRRDSFTITKWGVITLTVFNSHPAASLSVSPDRVQHLIDQSVTMNCGGNDTKWRMRRFTGSTSPSYVQCSNWGTMHGSSCTINRLEDHSGVYWCESGSGEFSNAVNITVQDDYYDVIILVSPVHPVTEGDPVTLSCRDKEQNLLSNVIFYHNNKLINNDSRGELKISAVSKSDEGFYKCQHSGKESPRSWMSVRGEKD
uniref:Ig-like domain-containing protein n=1 Tax=Xiphophorus maculatus TaxID=8083 RepID=A0A3B5RAP6_XIPMA